MTSSIKSHEDHQALISSCVDEIHFELDKVLRVIVEDRSYGSKKETTGAAQGVDLPHIRGLYDSLLSTLSILQLETHESIVLGSNKKLNKALAAFPCGFINVEEVASVALRLLRINSISSPKQVRADKRSYDELIQIYLPDLHCIAWKTISFLLKNVEIGTEVFERELGTLTRDQIKSDLKTFDKLGKGSERALQEFIELVKASTSFNGQVFVNEIVRAGILLEVSSKCTLRFASLLRTGGAASASNDSNNKKKSRYYSESDQKRLENAQREFCEELDQAFLALSRNFIVFESAYSHLSVQEHISLTENILTAIIVLFQSQHNYKFVPGIVEGEYMRIVVDSLSFALVSFQPAYLPPFLPIAIRVLNLIAGKCEGGSGLSARRALLQVDLMIHPRRLGPVTFRPASEAVTRVFEKVVDAPNDIVNEVSESTFDAPETLSDVEKPQVSVIEPKIDANHEIQPAETIVIEKLEIINEKSETKRNEVSWPKITTVPKEPALSVKRSFEQVSDDDEPLPQIVDSGPDDN